MHLTDAEFRKRVTAFGDWRGATYAKVRALIIQADPDVVEEVKWVKPSNPTGVLAYSHDGLIGTLEVYKDKVKFTFNKGAELEPPAGMSWLGAGVRRAIDFIEGDAVPDDFRRLFADAVALNQG